MLFTKDVPLPQHTRIVRRVERIIDFTMSMVDLLGRCDDTTRDMSSFKNMDPNERVRIGAFTIRLGQQRHMLITRAMPEISLTLPDDINMDEALSVA